MTDGFSCQEQIAQHTERRALHLAQVIQLALHGWDSPAAPRKVPSSAKTIPVAAPLAAFGLGIVVGTGIRYVLAAEDRPFFPRKFDRSLR